MTGTIVEPGLSERDLLAIAHYCATFNVRESMLAAGFAPTTAYKRGFLFLRRPAVAAEVKRRLEVLHEVCTMSSMELMAELDLLASSNIDDYVTVPDGEDASGVVFKEWDKITREQKAAIHEIKVETRYEGRGENKTEVRTVTFKLYDKLRAIETKARLNGLMGDKEKDDGDSAPNDYARGVSAARRLIEAVVARRIAGDDARPRADRPVLAAHAVTTTPRP